MKKVLSFILALSMVMMTMVFASVGVSAASALPITDDFSGAEFDTEKWNATSSTDLTKLTQANGELTLYTTGFNGFGVELDEALTAGGIEYKFDLKVPSTLTGGELVLMGGPDKETEANNLLRYNAADDNRNITAVGNKVLTLEDDKWYTVSVKYDCSDINMASVVAYETENPSNVGSITFNIADGFATSKFFYMAAKWMGGEGGFIFDNVSINTFNNLPMEDDFSGDVFDYEKWDTGAATTVTLEDGAAKLIYKNDYLDGFGAHLGETVSEGKIRTKFDFKIPAVTNRAELRVIGGTERKETNTLFSVDKQASSANATLYAPGGNITLTNVADTWFTIDAVLSVEDEVITVVVTNKDTGAFVGSSNNGTLASSREVDNTSFIHFGSKYLGTANNGEGYFLFDNVSISKFETKSELPISDDFEDSFDYFKWNTSNLNRIAWENGAIKLTNVAGNQAGIGVTLDEAVTTGKINVKFDINIPTGATDEMAVMAGPTAMNDNNNIIRIYADDGRILLRGNKLANFTKDKWYTVSLTWDCEDLTDCMVVVTEQENPSTVVVVKRLAECAYNTTLQADLATNKVISIGAKGNQAVGGFLIDNVAIDTVNMSYALPVSDDFNGDTFDFMKWNASNASALTQENGELKLYAGGGYAGFGVELDEAVTTGALEYKFDLKIPSAVTAGELCFMGGPTYNTEANNILRVNGSTGAVTLRGNNVLTLEKDKWYTISIKWNSENLSNCTTVAFERDNPSNAGTRSSAIPAGFAENKFFYMTGKWMTNNNPFIFDNVSINTYDNIPLSDDFSGSAVDYTKWDLSHVACTTIEDGALKIFGSKDYDRGIGAVLTESITSGALEVNYDIMIPASVTGYEQRIMFGTAAGDKTSVMTIGSAGVVVPGKVIRGQINDGKWYRINLILNCKTYELTATITERDGGVPASATVTLPDTKELSPTTQVFFGTKYLADTEAVLRDYILLDNISIDKYYVAPKIAGVTFVKYDDTETAALTNVSAGTKEIKVAFNTGMLESSLNDSTVKLVKEGTTTPVAYTGVYSDADLTWTIPLDNYLDANATYKLTLTSDVQNAVGTAAVQAYKEFITDAGEYKVDVTAVKGDTPVTALTDLATGDEVTLKAEVINTTSKPQELVLIYAGYNGKALKYYKGAEKEITATQKNITITDVTVTIDKTDLTNFAVYGWESYDSLRVIADSYPVQ